jgi:hypothetical protein
LGEVLNVETIKYEKDYVADVEQELKTTDPTSRQRGLLTSTNP